MPDVQDLPNVEGLGEFVAANMTQDKGQETPASQEPAQAQQQEPPVTPPVGELSDEQALAQFKTPKDLMKGYKNVQGWATKVSQENKRIKEEAEALKAQMTQMKEALDIQRLQTVNPPQQAQGKPKSFDEAFVEDPEKAIELAVERKLQTGRVADVLEAEEAKNPTEFQERYSYAMRLRQAYPNLATSPQGVRKLFELADRYREGEMKKNAERSVKLVFGDDVDMEKFRRLIAKDNQPIDKINQNLAYMPDTSSGIRADAGKPKSAYDTQISDAVQKGDVDSVIKGLFEKKLATG